MDNGSYEPQVVEFPGVPGGIKEANLDQYMGALDVNHLAQRQLQDLRSLALSAAKTQAKLIEALEKIQRLEHQIKDLMMNPGRQSISATAPPIAPKEWGWSAPQVIQPHVSKVATIPPHVVWPTAVCPHCGELTSTEPDYWSNHLKAHTHEKHQAAPKPAAPAPAPARRENRIGPAYTPPIPGGTAAFQSPGQGPGQINPQKGEMEDLPY